MSDCRRMFDHIDFAVTDLDRSLAFYTAVLAVLRIEPFMEIDRDDGRKGVGFGSQAGPQLWMYDSQASAPASLVAPSSPIRTACWRGSAS